MKQDSYIFILSNVLLLAIIPCCNTQDEVLPNNTNVFQCGQSLTDSRDGQTYNTVQIGNQCWMADNLNYGTMINASQDQTNNTIVEKWCYY